MLDAELETLRRARSLLAACGNLSALTNVILLAQPKPRKRMVPPETRRAMAKAQRRRWAARKAQTKT